MKISYNWLQRYINIDVAPKELAKILTSIGLETDSIEEIQTVKGGLEGLVIGEVLTCAVHENSDHLHVTTVNIGAAEPLQIVCGAPNVAAGQKVVVATVGTVLYSGEESFTIKRSKIRGVESFGMICAEDEIGIGASHDGIIVLPADAVIGTKAADYYGLKSDYVLEVDITPNRADACSHYGVARDVAAYFSIRNENIKLTKPDVSAFKVDNQSLTIPVTVENTDACPRYSGVTIAGVTVGESPEWLKNALITIGLRPINNVVDATNFVLHELGQPLHAFDADQIAGGKVIVKNLAEGTPFVTLDGVERKLSTSDLMICDAEKPMCIGGVFGGQNSGVTETTRNIFLESAYFNPVSIRKTARRHGLNTDASFRYERGCDPTNTLNVLKRCALLIKEVAGGQISSQIIDIYPKEIKPFEVEVNLQKINSLIGKEIGQETIEKILQALEIEIENKEQRTTSKEEKENNFQFSIFNFQLKVPVYRVDVQRDVDVIEDILRIYGYNNVEISEKLMSNLSYGSKPDSHKLQNLIAEQLTAQGFNEILNNSLTKETYYRHCEEERRSNPIEQRIAGQASNDDCPLNSFNSENCVKIMNALSADLNVMRQTLLFGGLESIAHNINRQNRDLKFYEFGNCYRYLPRHCERGTSEATPRLTGDCFVPRNDGNNGNDGQADNVLAAYNETPHLALWLTGGKRAQSWTEAETKSSIYELKAYVENILKRLGINKNLLVSGEAHNDLLSESLMLTTQKAMPIVVFGIVDKRILKTFDIEQDVFYADFNWKNLLQETSNVKVRFSEIPKFPEVRRDLALLIDKNTTFAEIEKIAFETERKLLKSINLFDVYEGKNLESGKKSYAVSFILQDKDKTLTDKQIDGIMQRIVKNLEERLGAKLR